MKKKLSIIFLLIFTVTAAYGQVLNKTFIDNWVLNTYIDSDISSQTAYIVNGVFTEIDTLKIGLKEYNQNDISKIIYLRQIFEKEVCCSKKNNAILVYTFDFSKKMFSDNKKEFKVFRKKILKSDLKSSEDYPVLVINEQKIAHQKVKDELAKIKSKSILDINIIDEPINEIKYGVNARNGLVIIYTKKPIAKPV